VIKNEVCDYNGRHALKYFDNQDDFKNGKEPLKTLTISKEVVITRSESGEASRTASIK
jgi:hypothetical protein